MRAIGLGLGLWWVALLVLGAPAVHAQPDSVRAEILEAKGFSPDHSPRGAVWRAAAVPGWGQLYNRQYLKIPFVYAGLAGSGYAIYFTNENYILYRHAAIYAQGQALSSGDKEIPDVISNWKSFEDDHQEVVSRLGDGVTARQLRRIRDKYRRWRDLSIVGAGLVYALTILDAYVSAHLLTFNVGDVALRVEPAGRSNGGGTGGTGQAVARGRGSGAGVRVRVRF